jgi:hypothetical protein
MPCTVSGSRKLVTPARSSLGRLNAVSRPASTGAVEEQLVVDCTVVEGDVAVGVDEPRHDGGTGRVDPDRIGRCLRRHVGIRTDGDDQVAVDQHRRVGHGRRTGAVDQRSSGDQQRRRHVQHPRSAPVATGGDPSSEV